ncbi:MULTISPECIES: pseudaminic acid synthase [Thiorhodovibrio]|uniref:pseudaminic acid synthase n=1 Tax=Thiorhodovibrio TaxID=61593 RepID=UPI00191456EA|nr:MULTISPECIES: pseudaminic acid synthase [Thiorhodovibrio]MBK5968581.1 pseudaminic acid synthase [Thiorhodovibrio winogradskyi]WPL11322.1 Pseudaminic acid synthase [Thiorhodovibrio litoralis]
MTDNAFRIGDLHFGRDQPPRIIAELSGNHGGSLDTALALIEAAARAGADAIKLQTYKPETMTLDHDGPGFVIDDPNSLWRGERLFDLYLRAATPWDWHPALFARAREQGLVAFSSPFDASAVEFLETLATPCYKIASFENLDQPLLARVAATGKPVILSTGMATAEELDESIACLRAHGCRSLLLLHCISAYPAPLEQANLRSIPALAARHGVPVGLSDHSLGQTAAIAATALGAVAIEKHLCLERVGGAVDAAFSLEPEELKALVTNTRATQAALGSGEIGCAPAEQASLTHRRSIYLVADLPAGTILASEHLQIIRPGLGLPPKAYPQVIGRRLACNLARGTPLRWEHFVED